MTSKLAEPQVRGVFMVFVPSRYSEEVTLYFTNKYGGVTEHALAYGSWVNDSGELIREPMIPVEIAVPDGTSIEEDLVYILQLTGETELYVKMPSGEALFARLEENALLTP